MAVTHKRDEPFTWSVLVRTLLRAGSMGILFTLLIVALSAALCYWGLIPAEAGEYIAAAAMLISAFFAGRHAVKRIPSASGLWLGFASGTLVFFLLMIAGWVVYGAFPNSTDFAGGLVPCLCGGILSGLLFSKPKKKRRK